jgi:hypothetical protein
MECLAACCYCCCFHKEGRNTAAVLCTVSVPGAAIHGAIGSDVVIELLAAAPSPRHHHLHRAALVQKQCSRQQTDPPWRSMVHKSASAALVDLASGFVGPVTMILIDREHDDFWNLTNICSPGAIARFARQRRAVGQCKKHVSAWECSYRFGLVYVI